MGLLQKFLAKTTASRPRETVYGILKAFSGLPDAMVNGEPKKRVLLTVDFGDGAVRDLGVFADAIRGDFNYMPATGIPISLTVVEGKVLDKNGEPYINFVGAGVQVQAS